ncbi:MAG: phosphoenolpyruvate--protein phosphotransferase, partial [Actinomycetales bacterium]|nr:phosphoenolpyruvate--protein phosphotransferase [Actinomycetales bacterium]
MSVLRGIGVGRGAAVGPVAVARPAPALPAEERTDPEVADAVVADALAAIEAVADALDQHA